jgi:hypothetical protein
VLRKPLLGPGALAVKQAFSDRQTFLLSCVNRENSVPKYFASSVKLRATNPFVTLEGR